MSLVKIARSKNVKRQLEKIHNRVESRNPGRDQKWGELSNAELYAYDSIEANKNGKLAAKKKAQGWKTWGDIADSGKNSKRFSNWAKHDRVDPDTSILGFTGKKGEGASKPRTLEEYVNTSSTKDEPIKERLDKFRKMKSVLSSEAKKTENEILNSVTMDKLKPALGIGLAGLAAIGAIHYINNRDYDKQGQ